MSDFKYEVGESVPLYNQHEKEVVDVIITERWTTKSFGNYYKHDHGNIGNSESVSEMCFWTTKDDDND